MKIKRQCIYCDKPILDDEPSVIDNFGDCYHLICKAEDDEGQDLNNDIASEND